MADPISAALLAAGASASTAATAGSIITYAGTAMSAFSGLQAISGGMQANASAKFSAMQQKMQTEQTRIRAKEEANEARKNYLSTMSKLQAGYSARGIDISSGTPFAAQIDVAGEATRDINSIKKTSDINVLQGYQQAKQYKQAGSAARTQGLLEGFGQFGKVIAGAV